jgi:hypothetical protein
MQTLRLLTLLAFVGLFFSSCEKLELEDHCPEEEQTDPTWDPGDVRVNDSTSKLTRLDDEQNLDNVYGEGGSDDSDDSQDSPDDMVNDDSDNEDENQSGRKAVTPSSNSGNSAPELRR